VAEMAQAATHDGALGGCDDGVEFAFTLDVIMDGLERLRAAGSSTTRRKGSHDRR
jgi:hypothetical protein